MYGRMYERVYGRVYERVYERERESVYEWRAFLSAFRPINRLLSIDYSSHLHLAGIVVRLNPPGVASGWCLWMGSKCIKR
jgi:hypothetical protein